MKTSTVLLQCAALIGCANANSAYLWIVDQQSPKHASNLLSTTSTDTASSIIARRRGMTDGRYLTTTDEGILEDIDQFGGYQQPLFGAGSDETPARLFIRISGYDGSVSDFSTLPDLWIEDPARDLLDDFKARSNAEDACEYNLGVTSKKDVSIVYSYTPKDSSCLPIREVENLPSLLTIYSTVPTAQTAGDKGLSTLIRMLKHLSATENIESTVLILPSPSKLTKSKAAKRSAQIEEEPLDLPAAIPQPSTPFPFDASNKTGNTTHPLPAIIPLCFSSAEACANTTNSCSGHGEVYKAHANCFKCKCGTTLVRVNKDGTKKTVQWGGNACQKKDVSTPFVLFASFGVVMTTLVAGGIGMLYSMGSQELPSVIGAGVAGPRAQK